MDNKIHKESLCPSSRYTESARLLGVRQEDGKVSILPDPLQVDESFGQYLSEDLKPEQSFRFVNKCMESGCKQWTKKGCGIAIRAISFLDQVNPVEELPACSIRKECRWHQQEGSAACKICPYIITDISATEIKKYLIDEDPKL